MKGVEQFMSLVTRFRNSLDAVVDRRMDQMTRMILGGHGAPKKFNKKIRNRLRSNLLEHASQILTWQEARSELKNMIVRKKRRHIRGRGIRARFACIYDWARAKLRGPIIYIFWNGNKCLYVGKGQSHRRLRAYRKHIYLRDATRLEVWEVKSKTKLPSAECLAVHLLTPHENENKAAKVRWGRRCPICRRHDAFKDELDKLLRLRS